MQDRVTTYRTLRIARMLHSDLILARAMAIDTNREARVRFVEADDALDPEDAQHGAWEVQLGNRGSGSTQWDTLPADVEGVVDSSLGERSIEPGGNEEARWVSLARWPALEEDAIVFTPRGWLANDGSAFTDGFITLSVVNKRRLLDSVDERVHVAVARSGYARMWATEAQSPDNGATGVEATSTR